MSMLLVTCTCVYLHVHIYALADPHRHASASRDPHIQASLTHTDTHTGSELPRECTHSCIKGEALSWSCTGRRVSGTFQRQQWGEVQGGRCWARGSRATFLINEIETLLGFQELPEAVTQFRQE